MTRIYTRTVPLKADIVDAFCVLQKGFTDQFVYYDKERPCKLLGLGRCVALPTLDDVEIDVQAPDDATVAAAARMALVAGLGDGEPAADADLDAPREREGVVLNASALADAVAAAGQPPIFFSFNRFDADNPAPADDMMASFPRLRFMLPEVVLIENERGTMLQVNSLGPVYAGRVARFARMAEGAPRRTRVSIPYTVEEDSRDAWREVVGASLDAIREGRVRKVVPSRRMKVTAAHPFSSKDLLVNLIDGPARGTVLLYRYADVFFCGCTPELLVRKRCQDVESMCLAGTCPAGATPEERDRLAAALMADAKNRAEHDYVVQFIRQVFERTCYDVRIPAEPGIMSLAHVQHLHTPARARMLEGVDLWEMMGDLHPTPATAGTPVGEAKMLLRRVEAYNRGFFAGACGYVDGAGNGEFSVALRTGVFDGEAGWVYAGCGVVEGSDADSEYDETALKFKTALSAFEGE